MFAAEQLGRDCQLWTSLDNPLPDPAHGDSHQGLGKGSQPYAALGQGPNSPSRDTQNL